IAETGTKKIWRGIWDSKNMSLNENHLFAETGGSVGPDGLALDEVGNLYVAVYGGSSINVYNKNGSLTNKIELQGQNPTNCAFDPTGKLGLVITEAEQGTVLNWP